MKEILFCDGLEEALIGTGKQFNQPIAVYSKAKVLEIFQRDMSEEEALECFEFNVAGAYVGEATPVFLG